MKSWVSVPVYDLGESSKWFGLPVRQCRYFDKLMYLHADALVLQNRGHLFDMVPPNQKMGEVPGL
jgi:alpha-N-acetylglucosamine transferase